MPTAGRPRSAEIGPLQQPSLDHLRVLEAESIHIFREVVAEFERPVMLYSIGKDSSVLLRLAQKAFYPGPIPFPLLHIDTTYKFKEMIDFRDSYTSLTNDVVIPGAKQKQISAVATVPAVASVSADPRHAVVLVFVNQTVIVGQDAPTDTASSVRVTMDKAGGRWLISKFDPV